MEIGRDRVRECLFWTVVAGVAVLEAGPVVERLLVRRSLACEALYEVGKWSLGKIVSTLKDTLRSISEFIDYLDAYMAGEANKEA